METFVVLPSGARLWAELRGDETASPLLLVMGANASGLTWPDALVEQLAGHHRVIRYDHRDTGRSTWAFDEAPYALRDLADDAVDLLDGLGVDTAHVVGMSLGGTLVQLLLLDHPRRLRSATVLCTSALGPSPNTTSDAPAVDLPGPDPALLELWEDMMSPRDPDAELEWRVAHWRMLNGGVMAFDADAFRLMEQRLIAHAGRADNAAAHAMADQSGLDRGEELSHVTVPTLVIEAPEDPIYPPPHATHLAETIGGAALVRIDGMGHAIPDEAVDPLADAILTHTTAVDRGAVDT
ncbi:MAG TPA: alpha/beta hydrolase [Euzebya sp.]|nr:alpha/beta hydrolase [Euzebya sp.]